MFLIGSQLKLKQAFCKETFLLETLGRDMVLLLDLINFDAAKQKTAFVIKEIF